MNKIKSIMANIKTHKKGIIAASLAGLATVVTAIVLVAANKGDESDDDVIDAEFTKE